jgi:hypothetical protein
MEKFNLLEIASKCRPIYDVKELIPAIARTLKAITWAARGWTVLTVVGQPMGLKFRVSGHHHKGYVILTVNGADLFDIYLINMKGMVKEKIEDVYLEDLIDTIDKKVEYIARYENR